MRDFALCGARQGLRVLDRAAFEKAGETFEAVSPFRLASRQRVFFPLFQKFLRVSGTFFKKFLTVPPFPVFSCKLFCRFFFEAKGAKKKLRKKKRR